MTLEAALAIALTCRTLPPSLAPIMAGIAMHESGGDPNVVHRNTNGTDDIGLVQVNTSNFRWLSEALSNEQNKLVIVDRTTVLDPCLNLTAGAHVLFARYNGNPPDSIKAIYAAGVMTRLAHATAPPSPQESMPPPMPTVDRSPRPVRSGRDLLATRQ